MDYTDESELKAIRERLMAGKLSEEDIKAIAEIVERVEAATKALRAAVVE